MTTPPTTIPPVRTGVLQAALERGLAAHFGIRRAVTVLSRRPFAYSSSYPIEALDVGLEDGASLALLFKDLSPAALPETTRGIKPAFLYDPEREIQVYRACLAHAGLSTATCYGAVASRARQRYWLFLEHVSGVPLWQVGEQVVWEETARWLAAMHTRLRTQSIRNARARVPWLRHDAAYYRRIVHRAVETVCASRGTEAGTLRRLQRLADRSEALIRQLATLEQGVIHGEFYPSNVLVQQHGGALRICPVDWEMAAVGAVLMDLGALTSGTWTRDEQVAMVAAYRAGRLAAQGTAPDMEGLLVGLDACQLFLALQWLGWSTRWTPPPEHAQDWLAEALRLADRIGL